MTRFIHIPLCAVLLFSGCDVRMDHEPSPAPVQSLPGIHDAVYTRNMEALLKHYQKGSDLNARNEQGLTPLHLAIALNHEQVVLQLLEWGVDPNIADAYGSTPLHMAASRDQRYVTHLLVRQEADTAATDMNGYTPAEIAYFMDHPDVVEFLVASGAEDPRDQETPDDKPQVSPSPEVVQATAPQPLRSAESRKWTSTADEQTTGRFVELQGDVVVLRTPDDQMLRVPLRHLRDDDRALARELSQMPTGTASDKEGAVR